MKQVTMTRDMRPYQADHVYTLPDVVADKLVAAGAATAVAGGDSGDGVHLAPDAPAAAAAVAPERPRLSYFTRQKGRK